MPTPTTYTPAEVAAAAHVTLRTVYNWIKSGHLHAVKAGPTRWLIPEASLQKLLTGQEMPIPGQSEVVNHKTGATGSGAPQSKPQYKQLQIPETVKVTPSGSATGGTKAPVVQSPKPSQLAPVSSSSPTKKTRRR